MHICQSVMWYRVGELARGRGVMRPSVEWYCPKAMSSERFKVSMNILQSWSELQFENVQCTYGGIPFERNTVVSEIISALETWYYLQKKR